MESPFKILILEDQLIIAEDTADMLQEAGYEVVGIAVSYEEATALIRQQKPDLAILDINVLGEKTGVDVGQYINAYNPIPFIYLTSHSDKETLTGVISTKPSAFLMKPFLRKNLLASIEIALQNFSLPQQTEQSTPQEEGVVINDHLVFKDGYKYLKLSYKDILYFHSDGNYVDIKTITKRYSLRSSMKKMESQLPAQLFFRCHKQYLINLSKVKEVSTAGVVIGDEVVSLGREQKAGLLEAIHVS